MHKPIRKAMFPVAALGLSTWLWHALHSTFGARHLIGHHKSSHQTDLTDITNLLQLEK